MKRKAIIAGILAVLLILCVLPFAAAQTRGDADGDGKVTAADARLILRAAVGLEEIVERAYPLPELREMLLQAGFPAVNAYGDLTTEPPRETDERVWFVAVK